MFAQATFWVVVICGSIGLVMVPLGLFVGIYHLLFAKWSNRVLKGLYIFVSSIACLYIWVIEIMVIHQLRG